MKTTSGDHVGLVVGIVPASAEAPGPFEIATDFVPERIVVDPEVEPLFTGRKQCETPLSKR